MRLGFLELIIILAVILIFGGWKSLPKIAKSAGEFCSTFKRSYKDSEAELNESEGISESEDE